MLECCLQINLAAKIKFGWSHWREAVQSFHTLAVKRVKDSSCDTCIICYYWRATRQIHRVVSSCCGTQSETKWQAPGRRAKKYGPATIREAQIAVSEVLGRLRFNTAAFCGCWNGAWATGCHLQNRSKTDLAARRVLRWRKSVEMPYFSGKISFPCVFPLNAFQNMHKNVAIFLTQQPFIFFCLCYLVLFLRNHVILHTFAISLPCLDTL